MKTQRSYTTQKVTFPIKDFVSKCDQICSLFQNIYWITSFIVHFYSKVILSPAIK